MCSYRDELRFQGGCCVVVNCTWAAQRHKWRSEIQALQVLAPSLGHCPNQTHDPPLSTTLVLAPWTIVYVLVK